MRNLTDIIRPSSVEEAVALLQRETPRTVALAGGTALVGDGSPEVEVVIDLAALSLDYIRPNSQGLHLGAMTTLQELVDSEAVRGVAGGHVARAAHASTSNLLRRQATVGGSLVSGRAPELATLLCALDARAALHDPQPAEWPLGRLFEGPWDARRGLLTEVVIPARPRLGVGAHAVRRTPTDAPIVAVAVALTLDGDKVQFVGLAAGGTVIEPPEGAPPRPHAPWPLRFVVAEGALMGKALSNRLIDTAASLAIGDTPAIDDYLASADYRRAMVGLLLKRALGDAWRAALERAR